MLIEARTPYLMPPGQVRGCMVHMPVWPALRKGDMAYRKSDIQARYAGNHQAFGRTAALPPIPRLAYPPHPNTSHPPDPSTTYNPCPPEPQTPMTPHLLRSALNLKSLCTILFLSPFRSSRIVSSSTMCVSRVLTAAPFPMRFLVVDNFDRARWSCRIRARWADRSVRRSRRRCCGSALLHE